MHGVTSRRRVQELAVLWRGFKLQAGNTLLLQTIPTLVTIATFTLYVLLGNDLTAAKAFTALSLFSVLRFPLFQLPMIIQQLTRAGVAFRRLNVRPSPPRHACLVLLSPGWELALPKE